MAVNASEKIECETPGASVRLVGRSGGDGEASSNGGVRRNGRRGAFVADADEVEIRARSAAGVTIAANAVERAGGAESDAREDRGDETVGGVIEVGLFARWKKRASIVGKHKGKGHTHARLIWSVRPSCSSSQSLTN